MVAVMPLRRCENVSRELTNRESRAYFVDRQLAVLECSERRVEKLEILAIGYV